MGKPRQRCAGGSFVLLVRNIGAMFSPAQLKEFKEIAECIDSTRIKFDRRRLLITTNYTTDEDYASFFVFIFFAGIMLFLAFVLSIIFKEGVLFCFTTIGLTGLIIGGIKLRQNKEKNSNRIPDLIFDALVNAFFILNKPLDSQQTPFYDQYPINLIRGARAVIISSTEYSDDAIVQICIDENNWITVLKVNRSMTAYHLEKVIALCKESNQY